MQITAAVVRSSSFYSFVLLAAFILCAMPLTASAQTDDYGNGTSSRADIPSYCPKLTKTVQFGSSDPYVSRGTRGGNVTELQKFLSGYFDIPADEIVSGYFGRVTEGYVIQFQKDKGLPALGIAGTLTRAAIAQNCSGNSTESGPQVTTSTTDAVTKRGLNGQTFDYLCPASMSYGAVWGDLVYTDDSSICGAAVHAGVITTSGGKVTITIKPGQSDYAGSTKNGITSRTWGSWHGSFIFSGAVTNPSSGITVIAPNGGERWEMGVLNTVTWAPYSYNPDVNPSKDITAYLERKNSNGTFTTLGKVQESGKASIHWLAGELDSATMGGKYAPVGTYYIRVVNNVTGATDRSDSPFTLLPKPISMKVNGSDARFEVKDVNKPITVSWTTSAGVYGCQLGGMKGVSFSTIQPSSGSATGLIEYQTYDGGSISYGVRLQCVRDVNGVPTQISADAPFYVSVLPSTASLQIINPNGGEKIQLGKEYAIRWNVKGIKSAAVALYRNDQWMAWINKNVEETQKDVGILMWTPTTAELGAANELGKVFKIYITGQKADGSGYIDDKSDATFSFVASPAITTFPISTNKSNYTLGESVSVSWGAFGGTRNTQDWVAVVPAGKKYTAQSWNSNADKISWAYTGGSIEGPLDIASPKTAGTYEAVYYPNNGFTEAARSQPFTVVAKPVTPITGKSEIYVGDGSIITPSISEQEARNTCEKNANANPTRAIRCLWNGVEYYKRAGTAVTQTPSCSITADKSSYTIGDTAKFSWTSTYATSVVWVKDTSGKDNLVMSSGSLGSIGSENVTVNVSGNPFVTMKVTNAAGQTATCTKSVSVAESTPIPTPVAAAPSCTITANASSYVHGDTIKFSWTSKNATQGVWVNGTSGALVMSGGTLAAKGSESVSATVLGKSSVTMEVTNAAGQKATCSKAVTVTKLPAYSYWVRPDDAASVCKHYVGNTEYSVVGTRDGRCSSGGRCVTPPFVWILGNTEIPEDRPSYLPADGILKRIQCVPVQEQWYDPTPLGMTSRNVAAAVVGVAMLPIDIAVDGISDFLLMAGWY